MKDFLSITDLTQNQIKDLMERAITLKTELKRSGSHAKLPLEHKSMAMIFDKASLRTRLSFEVAMTQLGGHAIYLAPDDIKLGVRESVSDSAKVIGSMADVIIARISSHEDIEELASCSSVSVVNGMTDREHPCQVLADLLTIYEEFGSFEGLKLAYFGDGDNNVTNSLALAAELLGMQLSIASPVGYGLSSEITKQVPSVKHFDDPFAAVRGAHVIISDTWISAGKEVEREARLKTLRPFQVTSELMAQADKQAIFMHCLPAYRGNEVVSEVIDGPQSVVFEEAENRLHAQKAVLLELLT